MPRGFFEQLKQVVTGTIYEDFIRRTPQDAHEFLVWLLDQMYMATQEKVHFAPNTGTLVGSMKHLAFEGWKQAFEKQFSPLTDLIFGMNRVQYTCAHCRAIHTRWETFNTLKITPKKDTEWLDCIKDEFTSEEIEGYHCDSCKGKHTTTKQIQIWSLPKVLMFTVRRFTPMGTKDTTPIQYDGTTLNFSSLFAPESEEPKKDYNLFGTVDHHGSMGGGHYTAQCLNPVWNNWHLYDDESAHPIQKPMLGSNTYMMFFRLQSRNLHKVGS
jgi:ubiquitin C-terminal hydrolase